MNNEEKKSRLERDVEILKEKIGKIREEEGKRIDTIISDYLFEEYQKYDEIKKDFVESSSEEEKSEFTAATKEDKQQAEREYFGDDGLSRENQIENVVANRLAEEKGNKAARMIVSVANAEASEKSIIAIAKKDLKERAATFPYGVLGAGIGVTTISAAALTQIPSYQGLGPLEVAVCMGGISALAFAADGATSAIKAVSDVVNYEKNVETLKQYGLYEYAQRYAERIKEDYQKKDAPKVTVEEKGMTI